MAKQVIVTDGDRRVFSSLSEAAEHFGTSSSSLSRAIYEKGSFKGVRVRYAQRVFAVKVKKSGEWMLANMNTRNTQYVPLNASENAVSVRDVEEVKDLTASWYFVAR